MKHSTIKSKRRHWRQGFWCAGATSGIGRMAMDEGAYDPGHYGVRHKLGRRLTGEEFEQRKRELETQANGTD